MIQRHIETALSLRMDEAPAIVLLGPRQAGKTTLALKTGKTHNALYLDLESPGDIAKLQDEELYLQKYPRRLVILDEVHRVPEVFPVLRGMIDHARREGKRAGLYLLLGSASLDLLKQSGESLAGRVSYVELSPLNVFETRSVNIDDDMLWVRGGFPESLLAAGEEASLRWRRDFIRTYLERDIPLFGGTLGSETLRRLWTMLAHNQGGILNTAQLGRNIGLDVRTVSAYLDLLEALFLIRRLPAWHANVGKRLIKSPRVYIRDSGIVHSLLGISDFETLLSHPVVGASWEGFVLDQIFSVKPADVQGYFYRTSGGAELDLVLLWPGEELWAIEIKRSLTPRPERGFHSACQDIAPSRRFVIYPGDERYPLDARTEAVPVSEFLSELIV